MDKTRPKTRRVGVAGRVLGSSGTCKMWLALVCVFVRVSVGVFVCVCLYVWARGATSCGPQQKRAPGHKLILKGNTLYVSSHSETHTEAPRPSIAPNVLLWGILRGMLQGMLQATDQSPYFRFQTHPRLWIPLVVLN